MLCFERCSKKMKPDSASNEKRASLRGPLVRLSIVILIAFYIGVLFGKSEALRVFAQAGCQLGF